MPRDDQAAGCFWDELGVVQASTGGTLSVTLAAGGTGDLLAGAVRLVADAAAPATSLGMGAFTVDWEGEFSVSYTVSGHAAAPFTIGIYASPDGRQPAELLQTYEVTDSAVAGTYTAAFAPDMNPLDGADPYVIAKLDAYDSVASANRSEEISAPLTGDFLSADGTLYVLGATGSVTLSEDVSGNVTVTAGQSSLSFQSPTAVCVITGPGGADVGASGVSVPVAVYSAAGGTAAPAAVPISSSASLCRCVFPFGNKAGREAAVNCYAQVVAGAPSLLNPLWGTKQGDYIQCGPAGGAARPDVIGPGASVLQVVLEKGPDYGNIAQGYAFGERVLGGSNGGDRDSAQVAIRWYKDGVAMGQDTNALSPAAKRRLAAAWNYASGDQAFWNFTIPAGATSFSAVVVYTDMLDGTYADNGAANVPYGTRGDLPYLMASWRGTWLGDHWNIQIVVADVLAVWKAIGFQATGGTPRPTRAVIASGVAAVAKVVNNETGYTLAPRPRKQTIPPPNYDTGFDITR